MINSLNKVSCLFKLIKKVSMIIIYLILGLIGKTLFGAVLLIAFIIAIFATMAFGFVFRPLNNYLLCGFAITSFLIFLILIIRQDLFKDRRIKGYHLLIPWIIIILSLWGVALKYGNY